MKLDANKLGLATAIIFGVTWIICSLFVIIAPGGMMQMSGHMVHSNFEGMGWSLHWTGFLSGLSLGVFSLGFSSGQLPLPIIACLLAATDRVAIDAKFRL